MDDKTLKLELPESLDEERIDRVVSLLGDVSRSVAVKLIAAEAVLIDGVAAARPSVKVQAGCHISMTLPDTAELLQADPSVAFEVVHVDDDVVVVNKPPGLVVHPGNGIVGATLVEGLLAKFPEIATVGEPDRPGIVHRIDKPTSGLVVVARTQAAYNSLTSQFSKRTVFRRYTTLVKGLVESIEGVIDAPIGRSLNDATKRAVVSAGKTARTHYKVDKQYVEADCSLLTCRLETGRTHQIRVHFDSIGHAVMGDKNYGKKPAKAKSEPPRLFLHARSLGFDHPTSGAAVKYVSELPNDLQSYLDELEITSND